jgi:hypothetical protein
MSLLLIASHLSHLIKYLVVFMTVVHTYFYIVVDTQRGCRTLKKKRQMISLTASVVTLPCPGKAFPFAILPLPLST